MSDSPVSVSIHGSVARIDLDDGKANAVSFAVIDGLNAAFDQAEKQAGAALLLGRPGRFSAGFDLATMKEGPEPMRRLVSQGAELLMRMAEAPIPIVAGCTGHALAMGALLLLASDRRVGVEGDFKLGLNEVAIGMTLPDFAVQFAKERISKRHLQRVAVHAIPSTPQEAVDAGILDRIVAPAELEGRGSGRCRAAGPALAARLRGDQTQRAR